MARDSVNSVSIAEAALERWTTLDLTRLSSDDQEAISLVIGGSARKVVSLGSQEFADLDPNSVRFITTHWGNPMVLGFLTRIIADDPNKEVNIVALVNGVAYSFQAQHQHQTRLDESEDNLEWFDFDPREHAPGSIVFLDWGDTEAGSDLKVIDKYKLFNARPVWSRIGPYNLRFHMGIDSKPE